MPDPHLVDLALDFFIIDTRSISFTGIWKHVLWGGLMYPAGLSMNKFAYRKQKEKELLIYDYVARHPELFEDESMYHSMNV